MSAQAWIVAAVGVATLAYLMRRLGRRRAGTCCGKKECPAAGAILERLQGARDAPGNDARVDL